MLDKALKCISNQLKDFFRKLELFIENKDTEKENQSPVNFSNIMTLHSTWDEHFEFLIYFTLVKIRILNLNDVFYKVTSIYTLTRLYLIYG